MQVVIRHNQATFPQNPVHEQHQRDTHTHIHTHKPNSFNKSVQPLPDLWQPDASTGAPYNCLLFFILNVASFNFTVKCFEFCQLIGTCIDCQRVNSRRIGYLVKTCEHRVKAVWARRNKIFEKNIIAKLVVHFS